MLQYQINNNFFLDDYCIESKNIHLFVGIVCLKFFLGLYIIARTLNKLYLKINRMSSNI